MQATTETSPFASGTWNTPLHFTNQASDAWHYSLYLAVPFKLNPQQTLAYEDANVGTTHVSYY